MIETDDILSFFSGPDGRPIKRRELARQLGVREREYPAFRALIRELIKSGRLVKLKRGRLAPPDPLNLVVGTVSIRRAGYAFVAVEDRPDLKEVFVSGRHTNAALDGDRVMVRLLPQSTGPSPEGEIIRVLERAGKPVVGTFGRTKYVAYVRPDMRLSFREVYINPDRTMNARPGQQVLVRIDDWPAPDLTPQGHIVKVLGFPEDPGVDILRVIHDYDLPGNFPRVVHAEARALTDKITENDLAGRKDFRETVCFTIDPQGAKDFDDAVSITKTSSGWRVGVHIADVAHYVRPDTALDEEAFQRATSVYLVDRVIPMLPPRLSNDLCSLKPETDRLTVSCVAEVDSDGEVKKFELYNSVIHSQARLTYQQVMEYFKSGRKGRISSTVAEDLSVMRQAAGTLRKRRFAQGSLELEMPEVRVILDKHGVPIRLELEGHDESHQLIEDFMLMANQCVATHFLRRSAPLLFRVHAPPAKEKIEEFAEFVSELGYPFSVKGSVTTKKLSRFLNRIVDDPRRDMLTKLLLRSLMKAEYQPENVGHFGLGFNHYCHFTSPIRRYPDLWVHRHLKKLLANTWTVTQKKAALRALPAAGRWTSDRERIAEEAERDSVRVKQLQYLARYVGEEYEGTISGFLDFGFFVTLDGVWVDGLVRFSGIDDDYYQYDKKKHRVVGRRGRRNFFLGDRVRVRVIKVDGGKREVDLIMADAYLEHSTVRKWGRRGRHGRWTG